MADSKVSITTGCTVYVRKGCPAYRITKGNTFLVLEAYPLGVDYSYQVRLRFKVLLGPRAGEHLTFYARHMNRLSDPFTRLHRGDPTKNIEIEFMAHPIAQKVPT
jgi:hypothetical protein